ncbi:MAG: branched-chain amino acid transport system substrate-binding protein [Micromonosporaceae bacterium]|nr:branched-chain amino acid transport system substrate-binding protein [Micromonosporaceae bacterium]
MSTPVRRRPAIFGVVALIGCAPLLAACTASSVSLPRAPATVTLGLLALAPGDASPQASGGGTPTTGGAAARGAQLAVDVVNTAHPELPLPLAARAGLSRGTRLALAAADTGGGPGSAVQATDQLIRRSHPAGIVVLDSGEVIQAIGQQAETAAVPVIDAYTSADALGFLGRTWCFRTGPTDTTLLSTALDALSQQPPQPPPQPPPPTPTPTPTPSVSPPASPGQPAAGGQGVGQAAPGQATPRRLVVLDGAGQVAQSGAPNLPGVSELALARGFVVAARLPLSAGAVELADKLGAQPPDAVVALVGTDQEAGVVNDVAQKLKAGVPVIAVGPATGVTNPDRRVLRSVGWSAEYAARNPAAHAVDEMYRQRYGVPMNEAAARSFTAVLALAAAVDNGLRTGALRADMPEPAAHVVVRSEIRQLIFQATDTIMPWDGIQFNTTGQNLLAAALVERRVGNDFQVVYPRELTRRTGTG